MSNIKIRKGDFTTKQEMQHAGIKAGFPSPAEDYIHETLDFNRDYIRHPEASFYGDVEGDVIGAQQYTQKNGKGKAEVFANAIKHDFRSKNPTTRWSDIIKLR